MMHIRWYFMIVTENSLKTYKRSMIIWWMKLMKINQIKTESNLVVITMVTWCIRRNCHLRICSHQYHQEMFSMCRNYQFILMILNLWYWFWTFKRRVHGSSEINVLSHLLEHIQTILWVRFYWNHQRLWIKLISSPGVFFWLNKNQILGVRNFGGKYI